MSRRNPPPAHWKGIWTLPREPNESVAGWKRNGGKMAWEGVVWLEMVYVDMVRYD